MGIRNLLLKKSRHALYREDRLEHDIKEQPAVTSCDGGTAILFVGGS